jgi:hypothetical protein
LKILLNMKFLKSIYFLFVFVLPFATFSQKQETFDIASFTIPTGWTKEVKSNYIAFTTSNKTDKTWCQIGVYKSIPSKGSVELDFNSDWAELILKTYKVTETKPEISQTQAEGWEIWSAASTFTFNNAKTVVLLTTITGFDTSVSIIATTNAQRYLSVIEEIIGTLKLDASKKSKPNQTISSNPISSSKNTKVNYAFTTSNFDDGWTSTVQEYWVEVTKGTTKVLLHFPNKLPQNYETNRDVLCSSAWNNLVAPKYSNLKNYFVFNNTLDPEEPLYISGDLTDSSGKNVFVVLFQRGKSGWIEFISPDRNTFIKNFQLDQTKLTYYTKFETWEPLKVMASYNKFALAPSDINGKWTTNFASNTYYANIYTGMSAGMSTFSSSQTFEFGNSKTYKWKISSAQSSGGNTNVNNGKGAGTYTFLNNWQIQFSEMEGKPKTFNAYFSCLKGARILWLQDTAYGGYEAFGKTD